MTDQQKQLIIARLKGMDAHDLSIVIEALEKLSEKDLFPQEIFPEGIVVQDAARARFILTPDKHKELMDIITAEPGSPIFRDLNVFPLGIIKPDLYETRIQLGPRKF
jgi:hypothetical protein